MPNRLTSDRGARRMLVLDSAYTHKIMQERKADRLVTSRDLGGYFDQVWTCHPVASLLEAADSPERFGKPVSHGLGPRHVFIEGKIGRFRQLSRFPKLNFLIAQWALLLHLLRLVRRKRIQAIRAENPYYTGVLGLIISRLTRLPLLVAVWGNPGAIRKQTGQPLSPRLFSTIAVEERVERFVLRRADRVLVQNENNRQFVLSVGVPREKTRVFRLGNQLHETHFVDPVNRTGGREELARMGLLDVPTLLVVSRLQKLKLVDHVIEVIRILKMRGRQAVGLFVGDGPYRNDMQAMADNLGVSDRIVFCGNRDQEWIARIIPAVSVVISPVTGMALGEVALGGAAVVAFDIDWHSELIETGVTGEIVPYLDDEAMAAAVERMLDDPARASAMGESLRRKALQILDPAANDDAQIAAYEELIGEKLT